MYGSKPVSAFRPTAKVPAMQRLNCIDPGSLADRVGLKPGDFIVEVIDLLQFNILNPRHNIGNADSVEIQVPLRRIGIPVKFKI